MDGSETVRNPDTVDLKTAFRFVNETGGPIHDLKVTTDPGVTTGPPMEAVKVSDLTDQGVGEPPIDGWEAEGRDGGRTTVRLTDFSHPIPDGSRFQVDVTFLSDFDDAMQQIKFIPTAESGAAIHGDSAEDRGAGEGSGPPEESTDDERSGGDSPAQQSQRDPAL
jgi:hypothetical protein